MDQTFIIEHDNSGNVVPGKCGNYKRMKIYSYPSENIKYLCRNTDIDSEETSTTWDVWKFSDEDVPTMEGARTGAINSEAVINGYGWKT